MPMIRGPPSLSSPQKTVAELRSLVFNTEPISSQCPPGTKVDFPKIVDNVKVGLQAMKNGISSNSSEDLALAWEMVFERGVPALQGAGLLHPIDYNTSANMLRLARYTHVTKTRPTTNIQQRGVTTSTMSNVEKLRQRFVDSSGTVNWTRVKPLIIASAKLRPGIDKAVDLELDLWAARCIAEGSEGFQKIIEVANELGVKTTWFEKPKHKPLKSLLSIDSSEYCQLHPSIHKALIAVLSLSPNSPALSYLLPSLSFRIRTRPASLLLPKSDDPLLKAVQSSPKATHRLKHWLNQAYLSQEWFSGTSAQDPTGHSTWLTKIRKWVTRDEQNLLLMSCDLILNAADPAHGSDCWLPTAWLSDKEIEDSAKPASSTPVVLLDRSYKDGFKPYLDHEIIAFFMFAFVRLQLSKTAGQVWDYIVARKLKPTRGIWNSIIRGHAECGRYEEAESSMRMMQNSGLYPDVTTWTTVIRAGANPRVIVPGKKASKDNAKARCLKRFNEMKSAASLGYLPPFKQWTSRTVSEIVSSFFIVGLQENAETLFEEFLNSGNKPEISLLNQFFQHYSAEKTFSKEKLDYCFELIKKYNLSYDAFTLSIMLNGLVRTNSDDPEKAISKIMDIMMNLTMENDNSTKHDSAYISTTDEPSKVNVTTYGLVIGHLIKVFGQRGIAAGLAFLDRAERTGEKRSNEIIYTTLIQGLCQAACENPDPFVDPIHIPNLNQLGLRDVTSLRTKTEMSFTPGISGSLKGTKVTAEASSTSSTTSPASSSPTANNVDHRPQAPKYTEKGRLHHPHLELAESLIDRMKARNLPTTRTAQDALLRTYLELARTSPAYTLSLERALELFESIRIKAIQAYLSRKGLMSTTSPSSQKITSSQSIPSTATTDYDDLHSDNKSIFIFPSPITWYILLDGLVKKGEIELARKYATQLTNGRLSPSSSSSSNIAQMESIIRPFKPRTGSQLYTIMKRITTSSY